MQFLVCSLALFHGLLKLLKGAFIAGLIVPREGGLAITITEKLEDMVSIIFLPLVSIAFILLEIEHCSPTRIYSSISPFLVFLQISPY